MSQDKNDQNFLNPWDKHNQQLASHVHPAGDMISELTMAMTHGLGLKHIANTIHPYPTQAEAIRQGADVHAAIPNYKTIFGDCLTSYLQKEQTSMRRVLPKDRLHLASSMPRIRPLIHPPILTSFAITDLAIMQRQNEKTRSHYKKWLRCAISMSNSNIMLTPQPILF